MYEKRSDIKLFYEWKLCKLTERSLSISPNTLGVYYDVCCFSDVLLHATDISLHAIYQHAGEQTGRRSIRDAAGGPTLPRHCKA